HRSFCTAALALLALPACFAGPPPADGLFTYESTADCPAPLQCAAEVGLCAPAEVLALPAPELAGDSVVAPALVRTDVEVTVTFTMDQDLAENPVVALENDDFVFAIDNEASDLGARQ